MKVTVLGATGGAGRAIATELVREGHEVVAANRRGDARISGARPAAADLTRPSGGREAASGADVVVLAGQPGPYRVWLAEWPDFLEQALDVAAAAGARFVFVDNLYMYAPATGPITPTSPEHAQGPKGRLRRELGERVLAAHHRGEVPGAVIGRYSDYFGPHGDNSSITILGILPALRGRRMRVLADPDQRHNFAYLPDVGRAFSRLVTNDGGDGRAWILPAAPARTQREMLGLVAAAAGVERRFSVLRPWMLRIAARLVPSLSGVDEVINQFDRPWEVDGGAYVAMYGDPGVTPLEQAVADTVAWYRSRSAS